MYATHIFDGLEGWITHVAHVSRGRMLRGAYHPGRPSMPVLARSHPPDVAGGPVAEALPEVLQGRKLLRLVEGWLRQELHDHPPETEEQEERHQASNPYMPSKHMAFYR